MREIYRRAFAAQAQEALIARPGQDEAELATSMGIELSKVVIYFTQVARFSPYRLWSDPLPPRHI
jgi:hypothetical protein